MIGILYRSALFTVMSADILNVDRRQKKKHFDRVENKYLYDMKTILINHLSMKQLLLVYMTEKPP